MTYVQNLTGDASVANYIVEPYLSFTDQAFAIKAIDLSGGV